MKVEDFFIEFVKNTSEWVLVVIFGMYVTYRVYKKYAEGVALKRSISILEGTIKGLLKSINQDIRFLSNKIEMFINRFPER